jgi:hypothetical protein
MLDAYIIDRIRREREAEERARRPALGVELPYPPGRPPPQDEPPPPEDRDEGGFEIIDFTV